jgi:hypothetical protein
LLPVLLVVLLAAAAAPTGLRADATIVNRQVDVLTRSEVTVTTPFDLVPARGYLPVKVRIRNGFPQERSWTVSFQSQPRYGMGGVRFLSTYTVSTPGGSETEHAFLVPLATRADGMDGDFAVTVQSGRLVAQGEHQGLRGGWRSVAFSKGLSGLNNLDDLSKEVDSIASGISSGEPAASGFDPAALGADWRTYVGFDAILLTRREWDDLDPAVRQVIRGWVRMGGHLHLFAKAGEAGPPVEQGLPRRLGGVPVQDSWNGRVLEWTWDGLKIPVVAVAKALNDQSRDQLTALKERYQTSPLAAAFGNKDFHPLLVFLILAAFAILVGPVNLQVWAGPGRRHRLFVTTPLISLGASMILLGIILFGDGIGGTGRRVGVFFLRAAPEERQIHLVQEQISRTGVLLGREFPLPEEAWMTPVVMRTSRWTHFDAGGNFDATFRFAAGRLGGDWFRSRSEQAHLVRAVIPSRARIELVSPGTGEKPPELFNSLGHGLKTLWYRDEAGRHWRAAGAVPGGQPAVLEPVAEEAFGEAWKAVSARFSQTWLPDAAALPGDLILAEAEEPARHLLPTVGSIRWRNDACYFVTQPVPRASAAPAP